ncbi:MAG: hypothetical protein ACTHMM_01250 [Agriterribacter sp.]
MNQTYNELEKEMINFNFEELEKDIKKTKTAFASSTSLTDSKICEIWRKIRKFIKPLTALPIVGKFVSILVDLLDSICPS